MGWLAGRPSDGGGHLLLLFRTEVQRRTGVAAWVRRGLGRGAKILYTEPANDPDRSLMAVMCGDAEVTEALEREQVRTFVADERAYDPDWHALVVAEAFDEGYPMVYWSGAASTAWEVIPREQHAFVEVAADVLAGSRPLSVMCQYRFDEAEGMLPAVCSVHRDGLRGPRLQAWPRKGALVLAGEVDRANHAVLSARLSTVVPTAPADFTVDLSCIAFLDISGLRALMEGTRAFRSDGGRVRLRSPRRHVERLIRLVRADLAPGVVLEARGGRLQQE